MRAIIPQIFPKFTRPIEGHTTWPYPDVKNLITTADGNLVDPVETALTLAWRLPDGSIASAAEVRAQWNHLKSLNLGQAGAWSDAVKNATTIRITEDDVDALVVKQLKANDIILAKEFTNWETYCADAQVALHSLSWALGPGDHTWKMFGNLYRSVLAGDWFAAEVECDISTKNNAGVAKRNVQDRLLLHNAGLIKQYNLDPDVLIWPNAAGAQIPPQPNNDDELRRMANVALAKQAEDPNFSYSERLA